MSWDALTESLRGVVGDDPMMLLMLALGLMLLKQMMPAPVTVRGRVERELGRRLSLAADLGDEAAVKRIADAGLCQLAACDGGPQATTGSGFLDFFKSLLGGGNLMPMLMIGLVLVLFMSGGGGCTPVGDRGGCVPTVVQE